MPTAFTTEAKLNLPGTPGLPVDAILFAMQGQYGSKIEFEFDLPITAGTQAVNFGTLPSTGVKAALIYYEPASGAPPVAIVINGGNQPIELSTGGFFLYASPSPSVGITSMSVTHTAAGKIRGWLLG